MSNEPPPFKFLIVFTIVAIAAIILLEAPKLVHAFHYALGTFDYQLGLATSEDLRCDCVISAPDDCPESGDDGYGIY